MKKISKQDIEAAHQNIGKKTHRTTLLQSSYLNELSGASLYFKCENFQKTGSFKARGAMHSVLSLSAEESQGGVATHSSGNHGQALAWAAKQAGIKAYVVMPDNSPKVKIAAVKGYGAEVTLCTSDLASRESGLKEVMQRTGATFIPPYNFRNTIMGQASCAKEMLEDQPGLQAIVSPVGGGGLLAGTCLSARYFSAGVAVYGAEPEEADDAHRSLKSGHLVTEHEPNTIADGLRTTLGDLTFPIIRERTADILLCSESEILRAMRLIWERLKIVVEPSSATALAVVLNNPDTFRGKRVGLILTGGNVDLEQDYFSF